MIRAITCLALLALSVACSGKSSRGGGFALASTTAPSTSAATPSPTTSPAPVVSTSVSVAAVVSVALPSGTLKVLTYNVAGLPEGISPSKPSTYHPLISPLLNAYDLVLVQEDFWYHGLLVKDVRHPFQTPPLTTYSSLVNDGLNTFSRSPFTGLFRQRWNVMHGVFNDGNDALSSKGFSVATHELGPGVAVDVYNLHADAGSDPLDIDARRSQFAQLSAFMATRSPGRPVIVAGDTNLRTTRPGDEPILLAFMAATGVKDVARTLGNLPETIDRVFFRSNAQVELSPKTWRFAAEMIDGQGNQLSDHKGVHVDLAWRRTR